MKKKKVKSSVSFCGMEFPVIKGFLPTLISDSIPEIKPLNLSPKEERELHERFVKKFGIDFGIIPASECGGKGFMNMEPPKGMHRGCCPGVFVSDENCK